MRICVSIATGTQSQQALITFSMSNIVLLGHSRSNETIDHKEDLGGRYTWLSATILTLFFSLYNYNTYNSSHIFHGCYSRGKAFNLSCLAESSQHLKVGDF